MTWVPWTLGLQSRQTSILIGWSRRHATQPKTAANTVGTTAAGGATGTQWPLHGQRSGETAEGRTCGDRKVKRPITT